MFSALLYTYQVEILPSLDSYTAYSRGIAVDVAQIAALKFVTQIL